MVGRALALLALLGWIAAAAAAESFRVRLAPGQAEYGKPLAVELRAGAPRPRLDTLDLSPLDADFVVETTGSVEPDPDGAGQLWRLHLYPRRPGELRIPSLDFGGLRSAPVALVVSPATARRGGLPIRVHTRVSETTVWLGQAVRVHLELESDSPFASLESGNGASRHDGVVLAALAGTRRSAANDGEPRTRYGAGWVLYPQVTGSVGLQLPPLDYRVDGVVTHRFYPPRIDLRVRALPAFVPPTMPVGRLELETSAPDRWFLIDRELAFLTLRVRQEGPPGQRPWQLLRQLQSDSALSFYPAREVASEMAGEETGDVSGESTEPAGYGSGRPVETVYQVPFAPRVTGMVSLPSLRLQYFDPASGRIRTRTHPLGRLLVVSAWMRYAVPGVLLVVFALLARWLVRAARIRWRSFRACASALRMLRQARTPEAARDGLMRIAAGESWPANLTLVGWLDHWGVRYPAPAWVSDAVHGLQECLYGRAPGRFAEIRPQLIRICYLRAPWLRMLAPGVVTIRP